VVSSYGSAGFNLYSPTTVTKNSAHQRRRVSERLRKRYDSRPVA
jgi:hypothetical protein